MLGNYRRIIEESYENRRRNTGKSFECRDSLLESLLVSTRVSVPNLLISIVLEEVWKFCIRNEFFKDLRKTLGLERSSTTIEKFSRWTSANFSGAELPLMRISWINKIHKLIGFDNSILLIRIKSLDSPVESIEKGSWQMLKFKRALGRERLAIFSCGLRLLLIWLTTWNAWLNGDPKLLNLQEPQGFQRFPLADW